MKHGNQDAVENGLLWSALPCSGFPSAKSKLWISLKREKLNDSWTNFVPVIEAWKSATDYCSCIQNLRLECGRYPSKRGFCGQERTVRNSARLDRDNSAALFNQKQSTQEREEVFFLILEDEKLSINGSHLVIRRVLVVSFHAISNYNQRSNKRACNEYRTRIISSAAGRQLNAMHKLCNLHRSSIRAVPNAAPWSYSS